MKATKSSAGSPTDPLFHHHTGGGRSRTSACRGTSWGVPRGRSRPQSITPRAAVLGLLGAAILAPAAIAQPPGDFGDAPVGDIADNILAYPGVLARWVSWYHHKNTVTSPVLHGHGTWLNTGATFQLGEVPPVESMDTTQTPNAPENDAHPTILLEALGPNPLAQLNLTVSTTADHDPDKPIYLNVLIDQNRTGEWKDGWHLGTQVVAWDLEAVVRDLPILMPAGEVRRVAIGPIRLADPTASVWIRLVVSDAPIAWLSRPGTHWDGTMIGIHDWKGEIEDHLLEYSPTHQPGQSTKGIFLRRVLSGEAPGGGGGGGDPKPSCDLTFAGPRVVRTPWCPQQRPVNFFYRINETNDGCDPGVLWGIYGFTLIRGNGMEPNVVLNNPAFFVPGGAGTNTLVCPDGAVLTLPAMVEGEPPRFQGIVSADTLRKGLFPASFNACYPDPPRFRVYRGYLQNMTCGSAHHNRTVATGPAGAHSPSSVVYAGESIDFVDFMAGDLIEDFADDFNDRPFPDPDFGDFAVLELGPDSTWFLDPETSVSGPSSMFLNDAIYFVQPTMPTCPAAPNPDEDQPGVPCPVRAVAVSFSYLGLPGTVTLTSSSTGEAVTEMLFPDDDWTTITLELADDFQLDSIEIFMFSGWIDQLTVHLDEIVDCNGNNIHDAYDIASGFSTDLTGDGVPDECLLRTPCEGYCGHLSPLGCWCDLACKEIGDCCEDALASCDFDGPGAPCPADLTGSGVVDVFDLLQLLDSWGPCPRCPADLTGNGTVDVFDLLAILDQWSPCP